MNEEARPAGSPTGDVVVLDDERVSRLLPTRTVRAHKGTHGTVLVVAGSLDHLGAALLATRAATRAGSGVVCLAVPASLQPLVAGRVVEAITMALPETAPGAVDAGPAAERLLERDADAVLIGPGLLAGDASAELVGRLLEAGPSERTPTDQRTAPPAVIDAEGLNILARKDRWWERVRRMCVLTPHPGEFARLDGSPVSDDDTPRAARCAAAARRWGQVVVLKGARTVIADPRGDVACAPFENPALATAGTGDVLAGTIASLLGQGCAPVDAAIIGVYLHGLAGERWRERIGDAGLVASDLPLEIALARRRLEDVRLRGGRRLGFGSRDAPRE